MQFSLATFLVQAGKDCTISILNGTDHNVSVDGFPALQCRIATGTPCFDRAQLTAPSRKPIIGAISESNAVVTLALRRYTWPLRDMLRSMQF